MLPLHSVNYVNPVFPVSGIPGEILMTCTTYHVLTCIVSVSYGDVCCAGNDHYNNLFLQTLNFTLFCI